MKERHEHIKPKKKGLHYIDMDTTFYVTGTVATVI